MPKHYRIEHTTRFVYDSPVRESVMEVRMKPRDEWGQQCLAFDLRTTPRANVHAYRDPLGNAVHYFDIPRTHLSQTVTAVAQVRVDALDVEPVDIPGDFDRLAACYADDPGCWEMTLPSHFVATTDGLEAFAASVGAERAESTLDTADRLCRLVNERLAYAPDTTDAESTIDQALAQGGGVCQDFAHVLIALLRRVGMPARYVSGYLFRGTFADTPPQPQSLWQADDPQRLAGQTQRQSMQQAESADDTAHGATHAWVEAYIPDHGWIGIDPTLAQRVSETHIRTAVGRDYADVPPTRGVYRGNSQGQMEVAVTVAELATPDTLKPIAPPPLERTGWTPPEPLTDVPDEPKPFEYYAQQMQQQQQS
ncbi:MAG: transglutaminase family protein [Planctomycetota bacterium]